MERLLAACSGTLEYLNLCNRVKGMVTLLPVRRNRRLLELRFTDESTPSSIDLSSATNLKGLLFCSETLDSGWTIMALETVTSKHRGLERISIHLPHIPWLSTVLADSYSGIEKAIKEADPDIRWSDLDLLLIQSLYSRSVCTTIIYSLWRWRHWERQRVKDWVKYLLPESTERGILDLVIKEQDFN